MSNKLEVKTTAAVISEWKYLKYKNECQQYKKLISDVKRTLEDAVIMEVSLDPERFFQFIQLRENQIGAHQEIHE